MNKTEKCKQADESMRTLIQQVVPEWTPQDGPPLAKLAGTFVDDETPLGHALSHIADFISEAVWMPALDLPAATFDFVHKSLMQAYRVGVGVGRVFELARHSEQFDASEIEALAAAIEDGESE